RNLHSRSGSLFVTRTSSAPRLALMAEHAQTVRIVATRYAIFISMSSIVRRLAWLCQPKDFICCSKVIMSGVNGNVIMSRCRDDNPDDERREAARDSTKSVSRGADSGITRRTGETLDGGTGLSSRAIRLALQSLVEKNILVKKRITSRERGHEST